jgi:hypothetical protein
MKFYEIILKNMRKNGGFVGVLRNFALFCEFFGIGYRRDHRGNIAQINLLGAEDFFVLDCLF